MTSIDVQKSNVYAAEYRWSSELRLPELPIRDAQRFANRVIKSKTWKALAESKLGVVVRSTDAEYSKADPLAILLGNLGSNQHVILHEMTHVLIMRMFQHAVQAHGPQFTCVYRALVAEMMPEHYDAWVEAFESTQVQFDRENPRLRKICNC